MNSPVKASILTAVTAILSACATEERLDRPKPLKQASLTELLTHPKEFHLHKVTVTGFLSFGPATGQFNEGSGLYPTREDAQSLKIDNSIAIGNFLTPLTGPALDSINHHFVRLTGTFRNAPGGHMGLWKSELINIESIEPAIPEAPARR